MSLANRLLDAIKDGSIDVVKSLLNSPDKIDAEELLPSLKEAAVKGNEELFDLIVKAGADVTSLDEANKSILMYASEGGNVTIVKMLLSGGADVNVISEYGKKTALMLAADKGHVEVVEVLVGAGASVTAVDMCGWTALMFASTGSVAIVKLLLSSGADVNVVSVWGKKTALLLAVEWGHVDVVEVLVGAGACVNVADEDGWTALMFASKGGRVAMVKLLLSGGADVNEVSNREKKTALLYAAEMGYSEVIEVLVGAGASVNTVDANGWTALMYASKEGRVAIVKMLLSGGADVNEVSKTGEKTALLLAAEKSHDEVVEILIGAGASVTAVDANGFTALLYASEKGSVAIVKLLLSVGADVNEVLKYGKLTALLLAAEQSHDEVVEVLIGAGASVTAVDANGWTAMMYASKEGSVAIVKMLLSGGADVNEVSKTGEKTALLLAAEKSHDEVVEILIGAGASVTAVDAYGCTALMFASNEGSMAIVKLLLSSGADVNEVSKEGKMKTALLLAADKSHVEVVEVLVGAGASVNAIDGDGWTALMYASKEGSVAIVKLLLSVGADVNVVSENGKKTALLFASEAGHFEVVEVLVGAGASVNAVDGDGWTALMFASKEGTVAIVKFLLSVGADVNEVSKTGKTALMLAVDANHVDVFEALFGAGGSFCVDGTLTITPIFTVLKYRKFRDVVCTTEVLTLKVLQSNYNDIWCLLVQVNDIPGIEDLVRGIVEKHPELVDAKDVKGRAVVDMATPVLRQAINSVRLWFGKYSPVSGKPEHTSATCFVVKAMDESGEGEPVPVALKLMRVRAQFERETAMRKYEFDGECVMGVSEIYPERELSAPTDPDVVEVEASEMINGVLTKAVAERLYCVVMPFADRNMFVAMKQERFAGKEDLSEVVTIFSQLVKCVMHMHGKGVLHGDIKPMNLVRMGAKWMLIDLDACCVIGRDSVGFKSSSAYIPPEAVLCDAVGGVVKVKSESVCREYGVTPLVAHESFDVWSLGCILYQLCSEGVLPLFAANQDDNLNSNVNDAENSLWSLCEWCDKLKANKLSRVLNQQAKNLLSLMLSKDPLKRPSLSRVLSHPFLSGKSYGRVAGEEAAEFDVFISYRVSSDLKHASRLYDMLTGAGLRVWWDKKCLESGKEWQKGFCQGLASSRSFVCLLSSAGTDVPFQLLGAESACDNVLLEHRLALELKAMDFVQFVFPLMIGEAVDDDGNQLSEYKFTKISNYESVLSVEDSLRHNLDQLGLGTPLNHKPSVSDIVSGIRSCNGYFIGGRPANSFENAVQGIVDTLMKKQSSSVASGGGVDGDPMRSSKSVSSLRSAVNDMRLQVGEAGEATVTLSVEEYSRLLSDRDNALSDKDKAFAKADSAVKERDELLRKLRALESERVNVAL